MLLLSPINASLSSSAIPSESLEISGPFAIDCLDVRLNNDSLSDSLCPLLTRSDPLLSFEVYKDLKISSVLFNLSTRFPSSVSTENLMDFRFEYEQDFTKNDIIPSLIDLLLARWVCSSLFFLFSACSLRLVFRA